MKNLNLFILAIALITSNIVSAQVSVNTDGSSANASAMLEVKSTTKGFLPPRMTESQRTAISSPAEGLLVYQTNGTEGYYYYDGSAWSALSGGGSSHSIGDTYGGGKIFWLDESGEHGLIDSGIDISGAWSTTSVSTRGLGDGVGAGERNTILMFAAANTIANQLLNLGINDTNGDEIDDWFIPSLEEMQLLYDVKETLNITNWMYLPPDPGYQYWTSTEFTSSDAIVFDIGMGQSGNNIAKNTVTNTYGYGMVARPIRKF